jgi:hypothetical protein
VPGEFADAAKRIIAVVHSGLLALDDEGYPE